MARYNEWHPKGLKPTAGTLLSTKLKNAILKLDPTLTVQLKNVAVNGVKMGCTGFVSNTAGQYVYICTDHNHGMNIDRPYYRTANGPKDYTGGRNRSSTNDELADDVVGLLRNYPIQI